MATAMELFWERGYEGVSVSDLTTAIGIAPPSLYAAFGSKAGLYGEVLDRYASGEAGLDTTLLQRASSLDEAVASMLRAAVASVGTRGKACMIAAGMLACRPDHDDLARDLSHRRRTFETGLRDELQRWLASCDAAEMARYLTAVMQGLSVHARDGATMAELQGIADLALRALPSPK